MFFFFQFLLFFSLTSFTSHSSISLFPDTSVSSCSVHFISHQYCRLTVKYIRSARKEKKARGSFATNKRKASNWKKSRQMKQKGNKHQGANRENTSFKILLWKHCRRQSCISLFFNWIFWMSSAWDSWCVLWAIKASKCTESTKQNFFKQIWKQININTNYKFLYTL